MAPEGGRYFFYGTLMDTETRLLVLGAPARAIRTEPATLAGYRRVRLRRRTYPVIVPDRKAQVAGCLAHDLDAAAARRLAEFEGREYRAVRRYVATAAGDRLAAWVFAAGPAARPTAAPWEPEAWRHRHMASFRRRESRRPG